ncbi:probable receptor-like protein kinase At5g18500 [Amborella trichopoda]|uniref:probable receptor-like protein kinase At5g18500 n=1 Tax=Amborella trichopoda TaxID=13333 RepID=UPI0009BE5F9C|nr:probable receptor-like protein kinase At5g18500 [Amborella trichopoda]|eukprot:XP_020530893.1 probable receptor-like protein kinase At5g18500 [Amborella trichopoda]
MIYLSAIIVLGAGILAAVIYKITKKRLKKECEKDIEDLSVQVKSLATESESPYSVSGLYIFSRREIAKATDNFNASNLIGEGSAGKVYKGMMPSGQRVAVKQINAEKKAETFGDEIVNVAKVRHPNLVCIVGYCDREEYCLVYEYCVNGNLSQWLWGDSHVLKWEQRIRIATGSARALWFLHNYPSGRLVHRDIKPTNILLDDKLNPKLSDFGLSKFLDVDESYMFTEVKGTTGYLDPEYVTLGRVSLASDVYSLGIVLLQLLSGKKVIDFSTPKPRSLVSEARNVVIKGGDISTLVDPRLKGEYDKQAFERVLSVAILCTASSERERPCMQEVLHELEDASLFPC